MFRCFRGRAEAGWIGNVEKAAIFARKEFVRTGGDKAAKKADSWCLTVFCEQRVRAVLDQNDVALLAPPLEEGEILSDAEKMGRHQGLDGRCAFSEEDVQLLDVWREIRVQRIKLYVGSEVDGGVQHGQTVVGRGEQRGFALQACQFVGRAKRVTAAGEAAEVTASVITILAMVRIQKG